MVRREINGSAVRDIRELVGISQPELARRCGVTQSAMSHIERGARNASPMVTRRIATELGVKLDSITRVITDDPPVPEPEPVAS